MRLFKAIIIILLLLTVMLSAQQDDKMRLAILDLTPQKVDESTAVTVSDLLITELFNTGLFRIIERGEMTSILKEQEFQLSGCTETECAIQMGKLLSARKILMGSISKLGSKFIINARIVDVEKGEMEFADKVSVGSEDELEDAVNEFARKLSYRIQGKKPKLESMNIKCFNNGVKQYKEGRYREAIDQWNKIPPDSDYYEKAKKNIDITRGKVSKTKEAKKIQSSDNNKNIKEKITGGMTFVYIEGGKFMMGSSDSDSEASSDEKPQHKVNVSDFWIGKYEVTVKEFSKFINETEYKTDADKNGWSYMVSGRKKDKMKKVNWKCNVKGKEDYKKQLNNPVIYVSWNDAIAFCEWFSKTYNVKIRLPYEAEWEYACRADTTSIYYWGDLMDGSYCWYGINSSGKTHPVGQKRPNNWGLYDLSGNVREWCMDWKGKNYYKTSPSDNPKGPSSGKYRVIRGGSWDTTAKVLRSAAGFWGSPGHGSNYIGFRVVMEE